MKKVLVLTSTFLRWKNDTTPSFVFDLSNLLGRRYSISVLAPHANGAAISEKMGNLNVIRFRYFLQKHQKIAYGAGIIPNVKKSFLAKIQIPLFLLSELKTAEKICRNEKINLIHTHWMIPQGLIGVYLKSKFKIPLVVTIHGSDLFPLKNTFFMNLQKKVLNAADAITVNSRAAKQEIEKRFPDLSAKVEIIPMGIDVNLFFDEGAPSIKNKHPKDKIVLFVGRLNEQKGVEYLIKAISKARIKIPNIRLLVIGDGEYSKDLKLLCKRLDLTKNVEFLGPKNQKELPDYYRAADVFVLPAVSSKIGTESFGLVLVEAMSCGACVIGSKSGGIKEIIQDNKNGLLAEERNPDDLVDKIIKVLSDKALAARLRKNALISCKKYDWNRISLKFESIYRRLK